MTLFFKYTWLLGSFLRKMNIVDLLFLKTFVVLPFPKDLIVIPKKKHVHILKRSCYLYYYYTNSFL